LFHRAWPPSALAGGRLRRSARRLCSGGRVLSPARRALFGGIWLLLLSAGPCSSADRAPAAAPDQDSYRFAIMLYREGETALAELELRRSGFLSPVGPYADAAKFMTACCAYRSGDYRKAANRFDQFAGESPAAPQAGTAKLLSGVSLIRDGAGREGRQRLLDVLAQPAPAEIKQQAAWEIGWSLLADQQLENAGIWFAEWPADLAGVDRARILATDIVADLPRRVKSPETARWLAIVPGLGHLYCGRNADALTAFLINGLFAYGAVEAFRRDLPVTGALLTSFELGWYVGNIRGAAVAARRHNEARRRELAARLLDAYPSPAERDRHFLEHEVFTLIP